MKSFFMVSPLFFFSILLNAQTVVIANDKMNVFYLGIHNPVSVAVEGVADEKIKVSTDNGVIIKKERGRYDAIPDVSGIGNIIIEWEGKKEIKPFKVKAFPDPLIDLGDWSTGFNPKIFNGIKIYLKMVTLFKFII